MNHSTDLIESSITCINRAKSELAALAVIVGGLDQFDAKAYEAACPNAADAQCLANAYQHLTDAAEDATTALKLAEHDRSELCAFYRIRKEP